MFHYIEQTKGEGGANLWVDAFHAANLLFEENPESFQILVNTPVLFRNFTKTIVGKVYNGSRHPLIRLVIFFLDLLQVPIISMEWHDISQRRLHDLISQDILARF